MVVSTFFTMGVLTSLPETESRSINTNDVCGWWRVVKRRCCGREEIWNVVVNECREARRSEVTESAESEKCWLNRRGCLEKGEKEEWDAVIGVDGARTEIYCA